jgi:hypothetical protein
LTAQGDAPRPFHGFDASRLVPLTRVEDRLAAGEIVAALREAGIEAEWREPHSNWFDGLEKDWMGKQFGRILVLDSNLEKARGILTGLRAAFLDGGDEGAGA